MNVALLKKVKAHILEEPRRFNLTFWGASVDPALYGSLGSLPGYDDPAKPIGATRALRNQRPPCGAVGCIAGATCMIAGLVDVAVKGSLEIVMLPDNTPRIAQEALGLTSDQANRLFYLISWGYSTGWPHDFERRLCECDPGTAEYAQVAAERIDHFIATGGAE